MQVTTGRVQKAKKAVIYGPEGVGKSSLAMQFPSPIFIDTEGSTTELDVARLPKPTSWTMLLQQVDWVKQSGQYKTLVIDTIDWAEMMCVESVCAEHQKKGIEAFGYGQGYIYVAEEIGKFLNKLSDLVEMGIHVVLTAHSQIVKFDQPDEMGSYDRYQLKLGQKTGSRTAALVKEWADMVLFINYKTFSVAVDDKGNKHKPQGGVRTIYTSHHPAWDAKNRQGLPDELPLDYKHIAHVFAGAVSQQAPTTTLAPPTQPPVTPPATTTATTTTAAAMTTTTPPVTPPPANIPQALHDLMIANQVSESEIQMVVSQKKYFPMDMPVANYPLDFVNGVLIGAWPKVFEMIQQMRTQIPFS